MHLVPCLQEMDLLGCQVVEPGPQGPQSLLFLPAQGDMAQAYQAQGRYRPGGFVRVSNDCVHYGGQVRLEYCVPVRREIRYLCFCGIHFLLGLRVVLWFMGLPRLEPQHQALECDACNYTDHEGQSGDEYFGL